jgi:hypothetical protein
MSRTESMSEAGGYPSPIRELFSFLAYLLTGKLR